MENQNLAEAMHYDWGLLWNFVTAISTFGLFFLTSILLYIANRQLSASFKLSKDSKDIANADFLLRLKNDFFTERTREIFSLFDNNLLIFHHLKVGVVDNKDKNIKILISHNSPRKYSTYEIDDYLLNHFEDLGIYLEQGVFTQDCIYEGFNYYIKSIYENEEIKKYIKAMRNLPNNNDAYDKFELLYNKMKNSESTKLTHNA